MTLPTDPRGEHAHIPQQHTTAPTEPGAVDAVTSPPQRLHRWPWIAAAAAVVLVIAGGVAYLLTPGDEDEALGRCQSAITGKLRSPSTAKFGESTVISENGNFGAYFEVSGQVDAQNGFGAMVRGDYRCKVTLEKDGRWLVTESTVSQG